MLCLRGSCWDRRTVGKREESSCFDNIRATGPGVSAPLVVRGCCVFNKVSLNTIEGDIPIIRGVFFI